MQESSQMEGEMYHHRDKFNLDSDRAEIFRDVAQVGIVLEHDNNYI